MEAKGSATAMLHDESGQESEQGQEHQGHALFHKNSVQLAKCGFCTAGKVRLLDAMQCKQHGLMLVGNFARARVDQRLQHGCSAACCSKVCCPSLGCFSKYRASSPEVHATFLLDLFCEYRAVSSETHVSRLLDCSAFNTHTCYLMCFVNAILFITKERFKKRCKRDEKPYQT